MTSLTGPDLLTSGYDSRLQIQGYLVRSPVGALDGNIFCTGIFLLLLHLVPGARMTTVGAQG